MIFVILPYSLGTLQYLWEYINDLLPNPCKVIYSFPSPHLFLAKVNFFIVVFETFSGKFFMISCECIIGLVIHVSRKREELFFTLLSLDRMLSSKEIYIQQLTAECPARACSSSWLMGGNSVYMYYHVNMYTGGFLTDKARVY